MYQSSFMAHAMMNVLTVLLVCLAAANAVPAHFPHGKSVVYKYVADVKAGVIEPAPFASQFGIHGLLHVRHDISDPTLKNAYYVTLTDVKYGLHNGHAVHHENMDAVHPIVEAAKMIQDPFLIVYDENGKFQGVKLLQTESGWSKNMKQAIASMLQLDLSNIRVQFPMKPHSFITRENTIHGMCQVAYDVHAKDQIHPETSNVFVVTKMHEPKSCTHFVHRVFNHVEHESCHVQPEDTMSTATRRVFEIESQGNEVLIKKLIGHGVINYFPWQAKSEAHYLLTNQTLTLESVVPVTNEQVPVKFQDVPMIRDVSFHKPEVHHDHPSEEDVTQGRHIIKLDLLIPKLKKMLGEAADYLEEDNLEMKHPDWKHGQTINRLMHTMSQMDLTSLEQVYNAIHDAKTLRDVTIRNIFLGMVPNVGTTAACHFTRNVIQKRTVSDLTALIMLRKLPMHVRIPSRKLLLEMESLLNLGESVSLDVRKASILCFATLVHKTFVNDHIEVVPSLLDRYLQHFMSHLQNEPTYHMKVVYMMAMANVGLGNIHKLLAPIVRGDVSISEKPHHIRVQAIWTISKVVGKDVQYVHDLLWPVLADVKLPVVVRIAAYDVLLHHLPTMGRMMNLYWFMVYEKNEHLYNYHVTTIQGLANSVDPCQTPVREMAMKILRFTRMRHIPETLSAVHHYDYVDTKYGVGEAMKLGLIVDETTGLPNVGSLVHFATVGRKPVNQMGVYWSITGLDDIMIDFKNKLFGSSVDVVTTETVKNILNRAAQDMPHKKDIHVDIVFTVNNQVTQVYHYNKDTWMKIFDDMVQWKKHITDVNLNWQHLVYDNLFEMHVPTDLGLPAVLATRMPALTSLKLRTLFSDVKVPLNLKLEADARVWGHGEYVMSIYNPVVDVWHSIRRTTSRDIVLPIDMSVGYNHETKSLKISLPRLPANKLSVAGISTHAKTYVTITDDETDMLKNSCATCHHHEVVTDGTVLKKNYQNTIDLKDTGLQYHVAIFDCEANDTPIKQMSEWYRVSSAEHKNTMGNSLVQIIMAIRQHLVNEMIMPEVGRCGNLFKVEPSILHPTSHVDMNVRMNIEDLDHIHDNLHILSSKKINVRSTVDVKAASTNASVRSWDVNLNIDVSQGHVNTNVKLQVTRVTPGEKNLKICVDAQKNYPLVDMDILKIGVAKEETNSKMTMLMGYTDEDKCVRDDTLITITAKGEMSEDQKKLMARDSIHGDCVKHIQNPLFQTQEGHIPKTFECIEETIRHTTLRKYTTNVVYKKVPQVLVSNILMLQDYVRSIFLPHVKYTMNHVDSGNARMIMEYPVMTSDLDVSVVTPVHSYELIELPLGHPLWHLFMDNTHISIPVLYKYQTNQIHVCTVYPQVLLTLDNGVIPFTVSDQWTLLSGDHIDHTFAVFVKSVSGKKVAMKLYIGEHVLEIIPTDAKPIITVNGNVVEHHEKGVMVPADEPNMYAIKVSKNNEHLMVHSQRVPLTILCTPNSVTISLETLLQGRVTGICGHMDGTHKVTMPKVYTVSHL